MQFWLFTVDAKYNSKNANQHSPFTGSEVESETGAYKPNTQPYRYKSRLNYEAVHVCQFLIPCYIWRPSAFSLSRRGKDMGILIEFG